MREPDNWLLRHLPRQQRTQLLGRCERVPLILGEVLCVAGARCDFVYFPVEGFISLLVMVADSGRLETGMVGVEGMLGAHLVLGVATSPFLGLVQGAGTALRLSAAAFRRELRQSEPLLRALSRYVYVTLSQTASSAACLHSHRLGPRLARWLLMTSDRAQLATFYVTHELLADMLGVRRVGVTLAAGVLQKRGLIRYSRGSLTILDRDGLEAAACSCYASDRATYNHAMN